MRDPGAVAGVVLGSAIEGRENTWAALALDGAVRQVVVLHLSPDPEVRAAAVTALSGLRGPGLGHRQQVLDVTACRVGVAIVALPLDGRSWGARPSGRARRPLSVAQVVTLGRPLARELAALHADGGAFGAIDLRDEVVVEDSGRAVLAVDRFAQRVVAGTCGSPDEDLRALTALLRRLVRPEDSRAGRRLDEALLSTDCGALAAALARVARPVALPSVVRRTRRPTGGERVSRLGTRSRPAGHSARTAGRVAFSADRLRSVRGPAVLALAVIGVALAGWMSARGGAARGASAQVVSPSVVPVATDWRAVIEQLDARRAAMFAGTTTVDRLDSVDSAAYTEDSSRRKELQDKGLRAEGLLFAVTDVQVASVATDHVDLVVTDTLPPYRLRDTAGAIRSEVPGRGPATWTITLRVTAEDALPWRFASVVRR